MAGDIIDNCEKENVHMKICLILNGYCRSQQPRSLRRRSFGRSPAETVGSNPTGGMDVFLL